MSPGVMADESHTTPPAWWSREQMLVWIILRSEVSPRSAERIAHSPAMGPKIKWALNELHKRVAVAVYGHVDLPIDVCRVRGGSWADLLNRFQLFSSDPGGESAGIAELQNLIRRQDVEWNLAWGAWQPWPAPPSEGGERVQQDDVDGAGDSAATPDAGTPPLVGGGEVKVGNVDQTPGAPGSQACEPQELLHQGEGEGGSGVAPASEATSESENAGQAPTEGSPARPRQQVDAEGDAQQHLVGRPPDPAASTEPPDKQLTYAQLGELTGRTPDAVRSLVTRRGLPRTIGSDGKALVTINQETLDQLHIARSSGDHRPMIGRSPGDHRPVEEHEAATPPPPSEPPLLDKSTVTDPMRPPPPRMEARPVSQADIAEAIIDQKEWILTQKPKESEILRQIKAIVDARGLRECLRVMLPKLVPERKQGRPREN
jgi:hypothetical protein